MGFYQTSIKCGRAEARGFQCGDDVKTGVQASMGSGGKMGQVF